ncbi:MAG: sterol desaturase family protein [Betaproteobacteria bacterium]
MRSLDWFDFLQHAQMALLAAGFASLLIAESLLPQGIAQPWRTRAVHVGRNAGLWIITTIIVSLVFGSAFIGVALWLEVHRVGVMYLWAAPGWLLFLVGFLALDLADYVYHRLSHQSRWLWLLHSVHHSDPRVDVSTNLRAHPLHILLNALTKPIVLAAIGIPLWVWMLRELLSLPVTQLQHSSLRLPPPLERALRPFILTPGLHRIHHSPDPVETNSNFGGVLPLWDKLFGTFRDAGAVDARYGLDALRDDKWQTVGGMLRTPVSARRIETF